MTTNFVVTAKLPTDRIYDVVSKGDTVKYQFDFTPWQEDNDTISSISWTVESGQAAVSNQTFLSGVSTALLAFPEDGRSFITVLATTPTVKKKLWLVVEAKDVMLFTDDYGS